MANTVITPDIIAKEALMQLENNCVMSKLVHKEYKHEFKKVGNKVDVRKPVKFDTSDGEILDIQDVEEQSTPITLSERKHVAWEFTTESLTLEIEQYSERYIKPAMITLGQTMDTFLHGLHKGFWNSVGTPGTTPSSFEDVGEAAQRMDEMAVPKNARRMALSPAAQYKILGDKVQLEAIGASGKSAYEQAQLGRVSNFDMYATANAPRHQNGAHGGGGLIDGANQSSTYLAAGEENEQTLTTDGWAANATFKKGDVFTIAGVYAVNPVPGESADGKSPMPYLQQFVVKEDADADGAGAVDLVISPAIITDGPQQTVTGAPADNAVITTFGSGSQFYPQNVAFHRNALALVTCPLKMPDGVNFKASRSYKGLSIRVLKDYNIQTDKEIIRLDVLYGGKAIYPELGCRLWG